MRIIAANKCLFCVIKTVFKSKPHARSVSANTEFYYKMIRRITKLLQGYPKNGLKKT